MFKLCKWIYQLGYDKGWDDAKRDENEKRRLEYDFRKLAEERVAAPPKTKLTKESE